MFWERFYNLCIQNNSKPNPIGQEIGISSATITKWSKGTLPNSETLMKIADYFNVSTDYLLGRTEMQLGDDTIKMPNLVYAETKKVVNRLQEYSRGKILPMNPDEHGIDAYQLTRDEYNSIIAKGGNMTLNELIYTALTLDAYIPHLFTDNDSYDADMPVAAKGTPSRRKASVNPPIDE